MLNALGLIGEYNYSIMGTLYIVATPIGNLEDITLRAIRVMGEVDIILAEDTRVAKKLLSSLNAKWQIKNAKLVSYHQHSGEGKKLEILNYLLDGKNIALVSDAGTPGISDPGNELIDFLLSYKPDLKIIPIPGASAITTALSVSGFRADKFLFLGFWPKKKVKRLIELIRLTKMSFVFYESPFRILRTLETLEKAFGSDLRVFVGRELTKMHETVYRGRIRKVKEKLSKEKIKGEMVVVVELHY
ncbi:16S rRNA (cytidine(1402)-2'-O)-methyltransferase [Candidatus Woesebacteria bacterium RIFCSPHIGHO2_02_FULL_39_13]|uniref:Ribosomal RNA small subunit methyltransferase I n=1 Tax=Candidatus Woesebacteria bacterium RIFCSPHIGHO2_02_FULL_39_13 TaxID=1802505 RepID=A0A1F7Z3M9_9BACT|nr:MAG: 16S rRNA (cytidine(1402)-2'-O)-methyltransferase [Candidatus Woesebacteria bacterium RIFCSPHIGHO2_02_FULL_39_13]OGM74267.1 MAG: 16S rRNA (cytidine(1402)-2'-O)-methyltransferase [Candidatus Woesebacteria bacterium RIFCSPLOWO2_12_FULL_39_9]